jgi:N4-gp56 family major capsid protein
VAKTSFATSDPLVKKVWEEKLFRDSVKEAYFSKFMGEGSMSLVQVKTQLEKGQGDKITFGIRMRLQGAGVTSGFILEGNEEKLQTYDYGVTLEQYRHAVRDNGAMDRKRVMFSIDTESKDALKDWTAEKIDQLCFDAIGVGDYSTADPTKIFYPNATGVFSGTGTAGTAKAALSATNSKLTLNFISALKSWAKTGGDRQYVPLRPVKVEGREYYVLLVHPDVLYDIRVDPNFQQALREAEIRGPSNPLFKGATIIWDGVVVHEHENVYIAADGGGAAVPWAKCVFMGAQSLVWAWGQRVEVVQETFDYKNEHGYASGFIARAGKPVFNAMDYGSLGVYLARTNVSGV